MMSMMIKTPHADSWSVFSVTVAINGKETVTGFGPAQLCFLFKLSRLNGHFKYYKASVSSSH